MNADGTVKTAEPRIPEEGKAGRRRSGVWLVVLVFLLAFTFQGSRGIYAPDEGFYVGLAGAMLETGDLLIPRLNYVTWLDKPPLSLWGTAAGMKLFGRNEFGARAFHGLCFALTAFLVFQMGKSLWGRRTGLIAGIIYATMLIPFIAANVITPDTPLAFWTTAVFFCFWQSIKPNAGKVVFWKIMMCAAFGLGFLTKGPAVLVAAGCLFVFLLVEHRAFRYLVTPWAIIGFAVFFALGLSWYWYVSSKIPGAPGYFWDNQVFGRMANEKYARNPGLVKALMYLPILILGSLPWSFLWAKPLWRDRKTMRTILYWRNLRRDRRRLLVVLWIFVSLVVLSIAKSKLPLYPLPIFPALALLTASFLGATDRSGNDVAEAFARPFRVGVFGVLWVVLLLGFRRLPGLYETDRDMRALYSEIEPHVPLKPYEIVGVNDHVEGLDFYGIGHVEQVTTRGKAYPFFVTPENLLEEIAEMKGTRAGHLYVCRNDGAAEAVRSSLKQSQFPFKEVELKHRRRLFVCESSVPPADVVRLAAFGDAGMGKGKMRQYVLSGALYSHYFDTDYQDGVLLLGDNLSCSKYDPRKPADIARSLFEKPYAPVIDMGIPFYAILGNHDLQHGLAEFELSYPFFHMDGRRYYRQVFGNGNVELFALDSNSLTPGESEQIAWLQQALEKSKAVWKVVAMHHPVNTTADKRSEDRSLMDQLENMMAEHGVSIVLQGHNHLYERLHPVRGINYITVGSGGTIDEHSLSPESVEYAAGYDDTEVFLSMEFDNVSLRGEAVDRDGRVVDNFVVPAPPGARDK